MSVHAIGTGPRATDLIARRGRNILANCDVCLYAAAIVPPTLDQIEAEYVAAHAACRLARPADRRPGPRSRPARGTARLGEWRFFHAFAAEEPVA